jgi:hypothetical protein
MLNEAAWTDRRALRHWLARRGKHKAAMAVAHTLLVMICHVLERQRPYDELGADYFDQFDAVRLEGRHVHRLEQLGFTIAMTSKAVVRWPPRDRKIREKRSI